MTKVITKFRLQSPLAEAQLARLAELRGVYGVLGFQFDDSSSFLDVEYDATRMQPPEVAALLRHAGIPVLPA